MLKTLWKISIRNILKHKIYALVNVFGLTLGFTAFILIALFLRYELTWDRSNEFFDRIYRVQRHFDNVSHSMGGNNISPHTRAITAKLINDQYPDFEKITLIRENERKYLSNSNDQLFCTDDGISADKNFFDVFSYDFIDGDKNTALSGPFNIVLSETLANKLFPEGNALGRGVKFEKKYEFKVTGIYRDLPENTSLRPPYITSFVSLRTTDNIDVDNIWSGDCMTFVLLNKGANSNHANSKIKDVFTKYNQLEFEKLKLCSLSKLHLGYEERNDYLVVLMLFGLTGLFILIMSSFNYINLSAAKASERGKEIAIKKLIGSKRSALIMQFLFETTILAFVALICSFLFTHLILPLFNSIVDKHIELNIIFQWKFVVLTTVVLLLLGLISGIYPSLYLSSLKIVTLVKGKGSGQVPGKLSLRKSLVMIQFAISVFLIGLTLIIAIQVNYLINKDLGFDKENILYTRIKSTAAAENFDDLRNTLMKYPWIVNGSLSEELPFNDIGGRTINWEGALPDEKINVRFNSVSYDYLDNFRISLIAGRNFSRQYSSDIENSCIINETAARCFGWDDPVGKRINTNRWRIIGVVKDYHYKDMHNAIEPLVLVLNSGAMNDEKLYAFRINSGNVPGAKAILTREFEKTFPFDPFEFEEFSICFDNEDTMKIYKSIKKSILFFSLFNIFLAIVGLLGLVSYSVQKRNKEIGIRKINGCSVFEVFLILNREYMVLILLSLIIAYPGLYFIYQYLPGAYKLPLQPVIFAISTLIVIITALLTTVIHTYRAANRNPVEALRYE